MSPSAARKRRPSPTIAPSTDALNLACVPPASDSKPSPGQGRTGCWSPAFGLIWFQCGLGVLFADGEGDRVKYRGHWFYVDDRDISSKSTFNLMLELFNLEIRAGGAQQIPLLAI